MIVKISKLFCYHFKNIFFKALSKKIFFSNTVIKINMLHIVSKPEYSTTVSYH